MSLLRRLFNRFFDIIPNLRVMRGAALLDEENCSFWWWDNVDPGKLNMVDWHRDILAQLYGSHDRGLEELGIHIDHAYLYGFDIPTNMVIETPGSYSVRLLKAWLRQIKRRAALGERVYLPG